MRGQTARTQPLGEIQRLDIGCGPQKRAGFAGIDIHPYPGVDHIHDIDSGERWPIGDDSYDYLLACHVIEHIRDLRTFFSEIHRVARDGATIRIETPHYSSRNSWSDPTHVHHFSVDFCRPFIAGYLGEQLPKFRLKSSRLSFGGFLMTWPARLYCAVLGYGSYEKHFAWISPASSVIVELEVCKPRGGSGERSEAPDAPHLAATRAGSE